MSDQLRQEMETLVTVFREIAAMDKAHNEDQFSKGMAVARATDADMVEAALRRCSHVLPAQGMGE